MDSKSERQTAEVIPFPGRARSGTRGGHGVVAPARSGRPDQPRIEYGSGWYHDVAIRDVVRDR